ncbi:MAG: DUF692 family protein [Armatimonadetes bacterium]|nr:DUF692 family protein [Armatimonadota bacterium]
MHLLESGAVELDWIKLSRLDVLEEEMAAARPMRRVLLHVLGHLGSPPSYWESLPWESMPGWIEAAGSPHMAVHLQLNPEEWEEAVDRRFQSREQVRAMVRRFVENTRYVKGRLPVPVLVENVPYYAHRATVRVAVQPEEMWEVLEATGAGMLLDTSHLRCAAWHLGVDSRAYALAMPLEKVREIHVSGPRIRNDLGLRDRHCELLDEDYVLLDWLLERTTSRVVSLEYGGTGPKFEAREEAAERNAPRALERQLLRLRRMLG